MRRWALNSAGGGNLVSDARKFVVWCLGLTYVWGGLSHVAGLPLLATAIVTVAFPILSVLIVKRFRLRECFGKEFGFAFRPNRWWLVAAFVPIVLLLLAVALSLVLPATHLGTDYALLERFVGDAVPDFAVVREQVEAAPVHPFLLVLLNALLVGTTINALFILGEEIGWRGLLFREYRSLGFWKSSWLIGLIWGLWHAPIILRGYNYPGTPIAGVFMMVAATMALSPIFSLIREKSGSIIAPAMLHGVFNGLGLAGLLIVSGGSPLLTGPLGVTMIGAALLVNLVIYFRYGSVWGAA